MVARTDPGRLRSVNEDTVVYDAQAGILILADGMGGHNAGDVASRMAGSIMLEEVRRATQGLQAGGARGAPERALLAAARHAGKAVFAKAQADRQLEAMGTTAVSLLFFDNRAVFGHIGDSRLYRLRNGRLSLLTRDHSLLQQQVDLGLVAAEDAADSHNRHLVSRALGVGADAELEVHAEAALPGDIYLLCSDGLNDMVEDEDIELVLHTLRGNLELAAEQLVMVANDNGGLDNVSVALAEVVQPFPAAATTTARSGWLPPWVGSLLRRFGR